jgi:hypothetical protein
MRLARHADTPIRPYARTPIRVPRVPSGRKPLDIGRFMEQKKKRLTCLYPLHRPF